MIWSMPCGAYTVFAIEDGWYFRDPQQMFPDSDRGDWLDHALTDDGLVRISLGCFAVTDGHRTVMVDTGIGGRPDLLPVGAEGGRLPEALAHLGIRPEDVELVVHTHLHPDHIGGDRTADGKPFFPEARYAFHRREADYWLEAEGPFAERARNTVEGFLADGLVNLVEGNFQVAPGISVEETLGHTPGHMSVVVISQGDRTVITGDVTHHPLQAAHPRWNAGPDLDLDLAAATRERMFSRLAGSGTLMAAGHYPRPGFGYVETDALVRVVVPAMSLQVA